MTARCEMFLYSGFSSLDEISIDEGSGAVAFSRTATETVSGALSTWQEAFNASGLLSGAYVLSYSDIGSTVRFSSDVAFSISFGGSTHKALGFNETSASATVHNSPNAPGAAFSCPGITYTAPMAIEQESFTVRRWGRHKGYVWHQAKKTQVQVTLERSTYESLLDGPIFSSKVRISPDVSNGSAYSATNLDGYLDLYARSILSAETLGVSDGYMRVTFEATKGD